MSFESIISHMNDHHNENLVDLVKKYEGVEEVKNVRLQGVDYEGLDIVYNDGKKVRVDFERKADESTLKDAIIALCMAAKPQQDISKIKSEYKAFKAEFGSVCLATIDSKNQVQCTYAPLIQTKEFGDYILISEVSQHFQSIKDNPKNIEVLFVEDESKAATILVRKRLRFRVDAEFIQRDEKFEKIFDLFEEKNGKGGGISTVRKMLDFHFVKLNYKEGSFVKGFGQAFSIDEKGEIKHLRGGVSGNPHRMKPHN